MLRRGELLAGRPEPLQLPKRRERGLGSARELQLSETAGHAEHCRVGLAVAAILPRCWRRRCAPGAARPWHRHARRPDYPPDFTHFDYVNPDAPKGGSLVMAAIGSFDSLNPYIIRGDAGGRASVWSTRP